MLLIPPQDLKEMLGEDRMRPLDFVGMKTKLRSILSSSEPPEALKWVLPATTTTDDAVRVYLDKNPPSLTYEPCAFDSHMREGSVLLDRCLARQAEIYGLETQAITSALEYSLADALQPGDLALSKVGLKATRAQASAGDSDANELVLDEQDAVRTQARKIRLAMHNAEGHPLNYGERIKVLRELYAENIRALYERLSAARIGLNASGAAQNLPVLPEWKGDKTDNLLQLVQWCRKAIRQIEMTERTEFIQHRAFVLGADGIFAGGRSALQRYIQARGPSTLTFDLSPDRFRGTGRHRILALGVALVFDDAYDKFNASRDAAEARALFSHDEAFAKDARANFSFNATVDLPKQSSSFPGGGNEEWNRPTLHLLDELSVWNRLGATPFAGSTAQARNANPVGTWTIRIEDYFRWSDGITGLISDLEDVDNFKRQPRWQIEDVVLFMQVATRGSA